MSGVRAVCFDLFNTLVNVGSVPEHIGRLTADVLGIDHDVWTAVCFGPNHEICKPTKHLDILRTLARSLDESIPEETIQLAASERQRRFDHALVNADESIVMELKRLKRSDIKLALISNASTGEVSAWHDSPLSDVFDVCVFSCDCGYQKPDIRIYLHAIEKLGVAAEECLYLGDGGSAEFTGAHAAGMHTVMTRQFVKPARYQKVRQQQGDKIRSEIGNLAEIRDLAL